MKAHLATVCAVVLCLGTALSIQANAAEELQTLRAYSIFVKSLPEEALPEGITKRLIEDQVLVTLRSKAPTLRFDPSVDPYLYVDLNLLAWETSLAGNLKLSFHRPAHVLVNVHRALTHKGDIRKFLTMASVWDTSLMFRSPRGQTAPILRSGLDRLLEQFLADYFRANR